MDETERVELIASMLAIAEMTRHYYEALLEQGWSEEQAFKLTLGWQHAVSGGKSSDA